MTEIRHETFDRSGNLVATTTLPLTERRTPNATVQARFSAAELKAIVTSNNELAVQAWTRFLAQQEIDLDSVDFVSALSLFVSLGVLASNRPDQIRA